MIKKCKYFKTKRQVNKDYSLPLSGRGPKVDVNTLAWCTHKESEHRGDTIGGFVNCNGEKNKCLIPGGYEE